MSDYFYFSIQDFEYLLLIFVRVTMFIYTAPFFSTQNVPRRFKVGFGVFMAMLLYQYVVPHSVVRYNTDIGYGLLVLKEAICGTIIGLCCNIVVMVTSLAGKVMDMEIGLSMVSFYDPVSRDQSGFTGTIFQYGFLVILLASNLHHYLINAFVQSFELIPVGHVYIEADSIYNTVLVFMRDYMEIAFKICLPVFCAMLLLNSVLGIMAKAAPQMHMFSIGMQLKVLVGLGVLFLTIYLLPVVADTMFTEMKRMMVMAVQIFYE